MPNAEDILWFKQTFRSNVEAAIEGTPFSVDMIAAIACQETGEVWPVLRKKQLGVDRVLELCVGDTLDANKGRKAFPQTKADLVAKPGGPEMFDLARQALVDMAQHIKAYQPAAANPNKFCHGFGMFQLDLQFFLSDPDYFLSKRYANFDATLGKCLDELRHAAARIGLGGASTLTDLQMASVAIAYNTGRFNPSKGLKQGFFDGTKFYGEAIFDFLRLSKTVQVSDAGPVIESPAPGTAPLPVPTPVSASGRFFVVDVRDTPLRLRSEPKVDAADPNGNVKARLPDGQIVRAVNDQKINGFREVETSLMGAHLTGFASADFLKPAPDAEEVPVAAPVATPESGSIPAVLMPRKKSTVTKRTEEAGPHSLNEPGQPGREGTSPDELRAELGAIIDWLAVDDATHVRYQPRPKVTFCNIYAHDYCHLSGVYLPRVWWTAGAIERLAQGQTVEPLIDNTIEEVRANGLFRWLRDFGIRFGWRQTGSLTTLQTEVNQGAIGLIVARRKEDGLSGHIVAVVPETDDNRARRNADGEVTAALQSQAGATNFRYGRGKDEWWKGDQFADSAFWLHA